MPSAGFKFLKEGALDLKANIVGQIAGTVGVVVAVFLVKQLPLTVLSWIVVCVLLYTSGMMFFSAFKKKAAEATTETVVDEVVGAE